MTTETTPVPHRQARVARRELRYPIVVEFLATPPTPTQQAAAERFWDSLILPAARATSQDQ